MEQTNILLMSDGGATGLMLSVRDICGRNRSGDFRVVEAPWPAAGTSDFSSILLRNFGQTPPHLAILCLSQNVRERTELFFECARKHCREIPVLLALESADEEELLALLRRGAVDFMFAPLRAHEVVLRLRRWQRAAGNGDSASQLKLKLGLEQFVGESQALIAAIRQIPKLARCDAGVFITGETGTGKEMFARAIHYLSPRAGQPFIPVNCGAIPADLVENELFGHDAGAFTGATSTTRGLIHDADGGTLFLDEIDSLPLPTQVKLLRFLQDKTYRPLGARKMCQADIRVIAASNADLEMAVRSGGFRSDLFYRINVLPLALPPLRERKEDIALLARHFAALRSRELNSPARELSPAALQKLAFYDWPGNVRELENIIQRAVVLADQPVIRSEDVILPGTAEITTSESFKDMKAELILRFERSYLQRLLTLHAGNITRAARAANKNRRAFWQLLRKHNLQFQRTTPAAPSAVEERRIRMDKVWFH